MADEKKDEITVTSEASVPVTPVEKLIAGTPVTYSEAWQKTVGAFASAVGKPIEEVNAALASIVGEPGDEAAGYLADPESTPDADLKGALAALKILPAKFNAHFKLLRGTPKVVATVSATPVANGAIRSVSILPAVPEESSFISALKVGGELKVDVNAVLSAVRASLANRIGLFDLPEKILEKMEQAANELNEPWGENFYRIQRVLTERKYGDILSAMNVPGGAKFMSDKRKKEFFITVDDILWSALQRFHSQLSAWQQQWLQSFQNPGAFYAMFSGGAAGGVMPPGIGAIPDTSNLRVAGEDVNERINQVFRGPGVPVAKALAYDASRIREILEDPTLPAQLNVANREQMLRALGVTSTGMDEILERNVTKYAYAIMQMRLVTSEAEPSYFGELFTLGEAIPFATLGGRSASDSSNPRRRAAAISSDPFGPGRDRL